MNQSLLTIEIDYEKEWKKTLVYKLSFGKAKPSDAWKNQLQRLYYKKKKI